MIVGQVNAFCEAVVRLSVRGFLGVEQDIEAVVDTGYTGFLTLHPDLIAALRLPFRRRSSAVLGDGRATLFNVHEATIVWDGGLRRIPVDASTTDPLVGMRLLYGHELRAHIFEGGDVSIRALPIS
jgi:clan AA aspartic protease